MSPQEMLRQFHARFDPVCHGQPALVDDRLAAFRLELFEEEWKELMLAVAAADLVGIADALADLVYVLYGTALAYGIDLDAVLAEVHRSNMTKEPGPTGKAVKGPGYEPPRIADVLGLSPSRCSDPTAAPESRREGLPK